VDLALIIQDQMTLKQTMWNYVGLSRSKNRLNRARAMFMELQDEISKFYKNAQLYVFPSIYEGFGIPILEAFHYQLPVAVANNTCLPEIGQHGVSPFDPYDVEDAKNCIKNLLEDEGQRSVQIEAGNHLSHSFSWDNSAKEIVKIASDVVHLQA